MSTASKIEWTEATWNPTLGCDRASSGCDNCYAIGQARIRSGSPHPKVADAFAGLVHHQDGRLDWTGRINLLPERLTQPLRWRKPRKIFVNSMSDLFHDKIEVDLIARVFGVMAATPRHTYQLLTKRHGRMRSLLNSQDFRELVYEYACSYDQEGIFDPFRHVPPDEHPIHYERPAGQPDDDSDWWPLPNVHLGVSVENQKWADIRIPALLDTPAAVRWISAEPLLGPIDLTRIGRPTGQQPELVWDVLGRRYGVPGRWQVPMEAEAGLDWVVTGGESGPGARPMHPDWARSLRDQCQAAGVAYLHKQNGAWVPESALLHPDTAPAAFLDIDGVFRPLVNGKPEAPPMARGQAITVRRVGKKIAGRELDGREWDEYPGGAA